MQSYEKPLFIVPFALVFTIFFVNDFFIVFHPILFKNAESYTFNFILALSISFILHESEVKELIIELRGEKVLIDRDVAKLYGVETRDINKAVKNNADKFPENYCFSLQLSEKQELVENFHRLESLKYSTVVPKAFTERGLYMLATILKGPRATATTFAIIESFFK